VIADFDRTLTKAFVGGKLRPSIEYILEEDSLLGPAFNVQARQNFDKYYPLENDPTILLDQKKALMLEWRTAEFALLIRSGLTRDIIKKAAHSPMIIFRQGYEYFFDTLKDKDIPLLIFSASGL